MTQERCQARAYSDEMVCHACRLRWDRNDPEPPQCGKTLRVESPSIPPVKFASGLPLTIPGQ